MRAHASRWDGLVSNVITLSETPTNISFINHTLITKNVTPHSHKINTITHHTPRFLTTHTKQNTDHNKKCGVRCSHHGFHRERGRPRRDDPQRQRCGPRRAQPLRSPATHVLRSCPSLPCRLTHRTSHVEARYAGCPRWRRLASLPPQAACLAAVHAPWLRRR